MSSSDEMCGKAKGSEEPAFPAIPWWQTVILKLMWLLGWVPAHIAMILDGNRRWARKRNLTDVEGHLQGKTAFAKAVKWCQAANVKEVSAYVLSVHNIHKRGKEEIDDIMNKFRETLDKISTDSNVKLNICGDPLLLPEDVRQKAYKQLTSQVENAQQLRLNLAVAYASRHNFIFVIRLLTDAVKAGYLQIQDVNRELLDFCISTMECPRVNLLIRTSGEVRYSDFMLWQCAYSVNSFVPAALPDFAFWNFVKCCIFYSIKRTFVDDIRKRHFLSKLDAKSTLNERQIRFLSKIGEYENKKRQALSKNEHIPQLNSVFDKIE